MDYELGHVQRDPCMSDDEYEAECLEAYHEQCYKDEMAARERCWREIEKQEKKKQIDNCPNKKSVGKAVGNRANTSRQNQ